MLSRPEKLATAKTWSESGSVAISLSSVRGMFLPMPMEKRVMPALRALEAWMAVSEGSLETPSERSTPMLVTVGRSPLEEVNMVFLRYSKAPPAGRRV